MSWGAPGQHTQRGGQGDARSVVVQTEARERETGRVAVTGLFDSMSEVFPFPPTRRDVCTLERNDGRPDCIHVCVCVNPFIYLNDI
mmetsp:Transcript_42880/g.121544  ORF Transcript_42880/g.121544 Transcript_42880/m.121544 type:complete len:86 (-) Transcript_42880:17-274(-)